MLNTLTKTIIDTIYPPRCIACTEPTDMPHGLCPACWRETHFISGAACDRCGVPLMGETAAGDVCEGCRRHPPAWSRGRAAVLYAGKGRHVVLALKHGDRTDTVGPLARWMAAAGRDILAEADLIAPVPLHWRRLIRRRYNQSAELGRRIGRISGVRFAPDLLDRLRATVPQESMNSLERAENQSGAFGVGKRWCAALAGKRVVLIDDVLTSGATLSSCAETLRAAGAADVDVLVLARVAFADSLGL